ncbi:MAG: hypothetical protein IKI81_07110, partial [Selenomonadaceae bacterium]|nr:hypothetical protein [Selenomonadaceae bacterium]
GNTAQYACGIFRKICALISSLFLEVHKVHLQKSAIIRTQIFSGSALATLCGIALVMNGGMRFGYSIPAMAAKFPQQHQ